MGMAIPNLQYLVAGTVAGALVCVIDRTQRHLRILRL
jgi:hypothetical protein